VSYEEPWDKLMTKYFHTWRLWEVVVPVDAEGWLEFCVRTWDNALNTQPTYVQSTWYVLLLSFICDHGGMSLIMCIGIELGSPRHIFLSPYQDLQHQTTAQRLALLESKDLSITPITHPLPFNLETEEEYDGAVAVQHGRDPEE
jgi:sulfite oxidase